MQQKLLSVLYKAEKNNLSNLHAAERLIHAPNKQLTDDFRQHTVTQ